MGSLFEEIDSQPSPLGEISLRRRRIPALGDRDIYEVKLGDEFLMSSLFVDAEIALAELGLNDAVGSDLHVVVGGLGLGYTAEAALRCERVGELLVVEALDTVIRWHQQEKVPLGKVLNADPRCRYIHGDFFALALADSGFDPEQADRVFDAILLDIDHSPRALLDDDNAGFYSVDGLARLAGKLRHGGVFALWSNEPPDDQFMAVLKTVFVDVTPHTISFYNVFQNCEASNTVYVARQPDS